MAGSVDQPEVRPQEEIERLSEEEHSRVKRLEGSLRTRFRKKQDEYKDLREALNQANMPETYYDYLARTYLYAFLAGLVGLIVGAVAAGFLVFAGSLSSPVVPVAPEFLSPLSPLLPYVQAAFLSLLAGALSFYVVRFVLLRRPYSLASARRREIETTLPHTIFFMYALSYGGMGIESVFRRTADSENQYGEVSKEFQGMINDIEYFGTDLITAIRNTRNRSPSPGLSSFLDDLLTVVDSGGDVTTFLDRESEKYIERANDEQESFLETLSLISEIYLALLVAGPLFVLVGLLVVAILGGQVVGGIFLTVYLIVPLMSAMMILGIDFISNPYELKNWRIEVEEEDVEVPEDERAKRYSQKTDRIERSEFLRHPIAAVGETPARSLFATVPVAVILTAAAVFAGLAEPSYSAMVSSPVGTTGWLVLLPLGVVVVPYTVLYERRRKEINVMQKRLPSVLSVISNANEIGMSLSESLDLVVRQTSGRMVDEMCRVRNDIHWNTSVERAFSRSANRIRVPAVSRVFNLIKEANKSSGDLHRLLTIAAKDATTQETFRRRRYQEIISYVTVVIVGFLVYVFILVLLDAFYVQRVIEAGEAAASGAAENADGDLPARETPLSLDLIPSEELRMAYFHSAVIQGACAGLISGKILDNNMRSGLKYAVVMVAFALVVYALVL